MLPPSPSPSPSPSTLTSTATPRQSTSSPVSFTPPLIAMVVVIAAAFVAVTYSRLISRHVILLHRRYRRYRRRRRLLRSYVPSPLGDDVESGPYDPSDGFHVSSPYGLDDSIIKSIPLSLYITSNSAVMPVQHDCAVCLLEFEDKEYIRTLPVCYHVFHVDCIDIWLRSHANCPLCRAGILFSRPGSPFVPVMAARIRPSLDDLVFEAGAVLGPLTEELSDAPGGDQTPAGEITQEHDQDGIERRDFLLKRSYSFSFERNLGSERLVFEPTTASPWRFKRGGGFWKPRVFSFRHYKGMKSPFFRRRGGAFFPLSERYGGGGSSRRSKSMASPMFMRSAGPTVGRFSSSRMRSGDPEALLSPERFNRR